MKNKKLIAALVAAAFIAVSAMDYSDNQVEIAYCEQMKADGTWPKGYQCE